MMTFFDMRLTSLSLCAALLLPACSTVLDESRQSFTSASGFTYEVRTRTMQGPQGTYQTSDALAGGVATPCRIDSPGDCEAAARRGINRFDGRD
jgi:hypothetical protein